MGKTVFESNIQPEYRGVVEGFYGPPWTHQNRLSIIRFLGQVNLNYYIYAPKDDPYHRDKWKEPYPANQLANLKELVSECKKNKVYFCFAISPGRDITYSSASDFQMLLTKLDAVYAIGVRHFALFLDDVPSNFIHSEDSAVFKSFGEAQVKWANDLYTYLKKKDIQNHLIFCPTEYYLVTTTPYLETIGTGINPDIPIIWTGEGVTATSINTESLMKIRAILRRKPFIWENYPVNDYNRNRLYLGPIINRTPTLGQHISGYTANPMNEAELSKIPLYTISDFLNDPEHYSPEASWTESIYQLAGREGSKYLKSVCEECRSSFLTPDESTQTGLAIADYLESQDAKAKQKLISRFKLFIDLEDKIKATIDNQALVTEMGPYLTKLKLHGVTGLMALEVLSLDTVTLTNPTWSKFTTQLQTVRQNTTSIADNVMYRFYQVAMNKGYQDLGISLPKIYTTIPTWESNVPELAVDGNPETFYWTSRAPNPTDAITIDYGTITTAKQAVLLLATPIRGNDYIKQGICDFSVDGNTWFDPSPVTKPEVIIELKQPFRYLRLRSEIDQEHWIIIREIELR